MKDLIEKLVSVPGPSGHEEQIRQAIHQEIQGLVDEVRTDALGNLIARLGQKSADGRCIMLSAHMDEIGVVVTHIDDQGFARFMPLGGVNPLNCIGGRVRFMNGAQGVISVERLYGGEKLPGIDNLYIDLGAGSRQNCPVDVAEFGVFERPFLVLGKRVVTKALDDRIGVAVLIEAIRRLHKQSQPTPHEIYFVFSVQEEVGCRGAMVAAFGVEPEIGIAVDVTGSGDTPRGGRMDTALGKGPAIKIKDSGLIADPRVVAWMIRTAKEARLPYQMEILPGGATDAAVIHTSRAGVPSGCVSIVTRYIHSPSEMLDLQDAEQSVQLVVALLNSSAVLE